MRKNAMKHDRQSIARRELKRDRAFRQELASAWDVEKPPRSYGRALQRTFDQLPDELIVRRRPLRSFARGMAGLAAACAVLCVFLLGVNAAVPQLAENLPGVGPAFQWINSQRQEPSPPESDPSVSEPAVTPTPGPTSASLEDEGGFSAFPVEDNGVLFQAVTLDAGMLSFSAQVPFLGRESFFPLLDITDRLGTFAILTLEDGSTISLGIGSAGPDQDPLSVQWVATPDELTAISKSPQVVFTLYEAPFWFSGFANTSPLPYDGQYLGKRIVAEFTVDLEAKKAKPSDNYRKEGLKKLPERESYFTRWEPTFTNGWMPGATGVFTAAGAGDSPTECNSWFKAVALGKKSAETVILNCYFGDDLITSATYEIMDPANMVESDTMRFLDEELNGQRGGSGSCYWHSGLTDPSLTGREYVKVVFAIPCTLFGIEDVRENAWAVFEDERFRLELTSWDGSVICYDMTDTGELETANFFSQWETLCAPDQAEPVDPDEQSVAEESEMP